MQYLSTSYDRRQPPAPAECPLWPEHDSDDFSDSDYVKSLLSGRRDGTARRVLLKAVSMFSLERGPLVPTHVLLNSFLNNCTLGKSNVIGRVQTW